MNGLLHRQRRLELFVLIVGCVLAVVAISANSIENSVVGSTFQPVNNVSVKNEQDFSCFQHTNPMHARLPCLLCHKRDDNSAVPKRSGHLPCAGCHVQQFAERSGPICTICHSNVETGAIKAFPPLRSFNAKFDHAKHVRQTGCATCHRPMRGGAVLSVPSALAAHRTCFQCHGPTSEVGGRNIGSCSVCHDLGRPPQFARLARPPAVNFSHARHTADRTLNCTSCHTVKAGVARMAAQVSEPLVSMHFAPARSFSCASCHNNKRAFGPPDFNDCVRCHTGRTFKF